MKKYKLCKTNKILTIIGLDISILALGTTIAVSGYNIHKVSEREPKVIQVIDGEKLFAPLNNNVESDINIVYVNEGEYKESSELANNKELTFLEQIEEAKNSVVTNIEINEEIDSDVTAIYFQKLQTINENNPLKDINCEQYFCDNYEKLLYDENEFSDVKLDYAALAYKRLSDNGVDVESALNELNTIMELQLSPTELDEEIYNQTFKTLLTTINQNEENVYDIYFPLAKQLHIVRCNYSVDQHYIGEDGITYCEELADKIR